MKLNRTRSTLKKIAQEDDCYVEATPAERLSFMWELTAEIWSLKDKQSVERRLQRNVTNLIKIPIISKENLISNKEAAGREKDKLDVKYLRGESLE